MAGYNIAAIKRRAVELTEERVRVLLEMLETEEAPKRADAENAYDALMDSPSFETDYPLFVDAFGEGLFYKIAESRRKKAVGR